MEAFATITPRTSGSFDFHTVPQPSRHPSLGPDPISFTRVGAIVIGDHINRAHVDGNEDGIHKTAQGWPLPTSPSPSPPYGSTEYLASREQNLKEATERLKEDRLALDRAEAAWLQQVDATNKAALQKVETEWAAVEAERTAVEDEKAALEAERAAVEAERKRLNQERSLVAQLFCKLNGIGKQKSEKPEETIGEEASEGSPEKPASSKKPAFPHSLPPPDNAAAPSLTSIPSQASPQDVPGLECGMPQGVQQPSQEAPSGSMATTLSLSNPVVPFQMKGSAGQSSTMHQWQNWSLPQRMQQEMHQGLQSGMALPQLGLQPPRLGANIESPMSQTSNGQMPYAAPHMLQHAHGLPRGTQQLGMPQVATQGMQQGIPQAQNGAVLGAMGATGPTPTTPLSHGQMLPVYETNMVQRSQSMPNSTQQLGMPQVATQGMQQGIHRSQNGAVLGVMGATGPTPTLPPSHRQMLPVYETDMVQRSQSMPNSTQQLGMPQVTSQGMQQGIHRSQNGAVLGAMGATGPTPTLPPSHGQMPSQMPHAYSLPNGMQQLGMSQQRSNGLGMLPQPQPYHHHQEGSAPNSQRKVSMKFVNSLTRKLNEVIDSSRSSDSTGSLHDSSASLQEQEHVPLRQQPPMVQSHAGAQATAGTASSPKRAAAEENPSETFSKRNLGMKRAIQSKDPTSKGKSPNKDPKKQEDQTEKKRWWPQTKMKKSASASSIASSAALLFGKDKKMEEWQEARAKYEAEEKRRHRTEAWRQMAMGS